MRRTLFVVVTTCIAIAATAQTASNAPSIDDLVGHYRLDSGQVLTLENVNGKVVVKTRGLSQNVLTVTPEGHFNYPASSAYLTFGATTDGPTKSLQYHFEDRAYTAIRMDDAAFKADSDAWDLKIKNQTASPECAVSLKRLIDEIRAGEPDYSKLSPQLARTLRLQLQMLQSRFTTAGPTKDITFKSVNASGSEIFDVTFENGSTTTWMVQCLDNGHFGIAGVRL